MSYINTLVESKKQLIRNTQDLDITYITPRLIASSFPSQQDQTPLNHIDEKFQTYQIEKVSRFMNERHSGKYLILNLSGIYYEKSKFNNQVIDLEWKHHYQINLSMLFLICEKIELFLKAVDSNVVLVHCLSGKGRTGTLISCYLLYSSRFQNSKDAIQYFNFKRFSSVKSCIEPSQKRYIEYFKVLLTQKLSPQLKYIKSYTLSAIPDFNNESCRPYIEIYNQKDFKLVYTDQDLITKQRQFKRKEQYFQNKIQRQIIEKNPIIGDFIVKIMHNGILITKGKHSNQLVSRVTYNTHFIKNKYLLQLSLLDFQLSELDPHSFHNDDKFPQQFSLQLEFEDYIEQNAVYQQNGFKIYQDHLQPLKPELKNIEDVLNRYKAKSLEQSQKLVFGDIFFDDIQKVLTDQNKTIEHFQTRDNFLDDEVNNEKEDKI